MTKRTKLPTVQELAEHAREIARRFNIELVEDAVKVPKPERASAEIWRDKNGNFAEATVFVQPITTEANYALALHELGHAICPNGVARPLKNKDVEKLSHEELYKLKLVEEHTAWDWAEWISLDWTLEMQAVRDHGIKSYEIGRAQGPEPQLTVQQIMQELVEMIGGAPPAPPPHSAPQPTKPAAPHDSKAVKAWLKKVKL